MEAIYHLLQPLGTMNPVFLVLGLAIWLIYTITRRRDFYKNLVRPVYNH